MSVDGPTRRERQRGETLAEIKARAMDQVAAGGAAAVSLNAIARAMGMSPAALYRYFDGRDALLAEPVVEAYGALADALQRAAGKRADRAAGGAAGDGAARLVAVAHAYRDWALAHPNSYLLIFATSSGSGVELAPEATVTAAQRGMDGILGALAGGAGGRGGPRPR